MFRHGFRLAFTFPIVARWWTAATIVYLSCVSLATPICANELANLMRRVGKVADDTPLGKIDDVAEDLGTSQAAQQLVAREGIHAKDALERSQAVSRLLRAVVEEGDPWLRRLETWDEPTREAALVLARGSEVILSGVPDIATRGRFLRNGGAETVAALGRFDDLVPDAIKFDAAVRGGQLLAGPGQTALALQDFGKFIHEHDEQAHRFWINCVRPHWKLWVGSGALAAIMFAPEEYLDEAGNLTEHGLEKVARAGGQFLSSALTGTIRGAGDGAKEVVRASADTADTAVATFLSSGWGIVAGLTIMLTLAMVIPQARRSLCAVGRFISRRARRAR